MSDYYMRSVNGTIKKTEKSLINNVLKTKGPLKKESESTFFKNM
jgi:hypothetical protein